MQGAQQAKKNDGAATPACVKLGGLIQVCGGQGT